MPGPVYCTKIASRLARTYTDKHGLKDLARELLGVDLSKQQQLSDWGAADLTDSQVAYAASDVLHLHALKDKLDAMLAREHRDALAQACFRFLPDHVRLDAAGWAMEDVSPILEGCRPGERPAHCALSMRSASQAIPSRCRRARQELPPARPEPCARARTCDRAWPATEHPNRGGRDAPWRFRYSRT